MNHIYGDLSNLNAPYDAVPLQGVGQPFNQDDPSYPWLQESQDTLVLQQDTNEGLTSQGGCLLVEDGKLGPKTCGALQHFGVMNSVQTCLNHAPESPPVPPEIPCGSAPPRGGGAPAPSPEEELVKAGSTGVPGWAIGLGLGAVAIVAVMLLKGKKRKR